MPMINEFLDDMVKGNDILPVKVSKEHMARGKRNTPGKCPGVLAILDSFVWGMDDPRATEGVTVVVGSKTKSLGNRVVVKWSGAPYCRWLAQIHIPPGSGGFHPKRFDDGEQKLPGAMVLVNWTKATSKPMAQSVKEKLASPTYRAMYKVRRREVLPRGGKYRVYNED